MKYVVRALGLVVVIELILLFSGIIPAQIAGVLIVITEVTAFLLGGTLVLSTIKTVRSKVRKGATAYEAFGDCFQGILPDKVLFLVKHEIGIFASLFRLLRWKKDISSDAVEIKYGQQMRQLLAVLLFVGIIETVAVGLLLPWFEVRLALLLVSIYGMIWLLGCFAATLMYPHYIDGNKLVIRFLHTQTIIVPLGLITGVASGHKDAPVNKTVAFDSDTLFLNMMSHTNLGINIADSTDIVLNGKPLETKIDVVRFATDDTAVALQAIQEKLA